MNTGQKIKFMRKARNMTQQGLADLLHCTKGNVAQLEAAEHCTTRVFSEIALALNFEAEIEFEDLTKNKTENTCTV